MFASIFSLIFFFFVIVFVIGLSLLRSVLNLFLGKRPSRRPDSTREKQGRYSATSDSYRTTDSQTRRREKIFDDSDGEYVDFEEIKN